MIHWRWRRRSKKVWWRFERRDISGQGLKARPEPEAWGDRTYNGTAKSEKLSVLLTVTFLQCEMGPVHIYAQKLLFSGVTCWRMELEIGWLRNCVAFEMVMG